MSDRSGKLRIKERDKTVYESRKQCLGVNTRLITDLKTDKKVIKQ